MSFEYLVNSLFNILGLFNSWAMTNALTRVILGWMSGSNDIRPVLMMRIAAQNAKLRSTGFSYVISSKMVVAIFLGWFLYTELWEHYYTKNDRIASRSEPDWSELLNGFHIEPTTTLYVIRRRKNINNKCVVTLYVIELYIWYGLDSFIYYHMHGLEWYKIAPIESPI